MKLAGKLTAVPTQHDDQTAYFEVELSDGTKGWVSDFCIVKEAEAGAVKMPLKIYKRPDILSGTKRQFEAMEIVAICEEKPNWRQVIGEGRKKSGWIESQGITQEKEDIVKAAVLSLSLRAKGKAPTLEDIEEVLKEAPYPDNYFTQKFREKYKISFKGAPLPPLEPAPLEDAPEPTPEHSLPLPVEQ